MRYVGFEREEEAEEWASSMLGKPKSYRFFRTMSCVDENGDFASVVVLTNFSQRNVDINLFIDISKFTLSAAIDQFNDVFDFLFNKLKVSRVTALIGRTNMKMFNQVERYGFRYEGKMLRALDGGEDLLIYGMLPEDFINHKWYRN